jgi:signal transduction histidine kinase/CheY-like chemotaxis protein
LSGLAQLIEQHSRDIVARFVASTQHGDLPPTGLSRSLLIDHIPQFLDEIVVELRRTRAVDAQQDATDASGTARQHGEQRWSLGYDVEALVREYGVLRHAILSLAKEQALQLEIDEFDVLSKCLSVGVADAVSQYTRFHDHELGLQKAQLEFLAEAGQELSSSLDYRSTISRLTSLLIPRLCDWCAIHTSGDPNATPIVAHVDAAQAELVRELFVRFPSEAAQSRHGTVLRTGDAELVTDVYAAFDEATAQSEEHRQLLERIGTKSTLTIAMRVNQHVFGAVTLAYSSSSRRYGPADLPLARELVRRASVSIDNARLYELSQGERSNAEAATRAKDELVATVSHELRTPLNAILGWVRLMRGGSLSDSKREHALEVIERNATAQNQLVSDLLDISRITTGKIRINSSQLDFANIIDVAVEGVRPAAEAKRIELVTEIEHVDALMRGDGDRLQQVVWNLLSNAVKFTPKGGRVQVRLARADSELQLDVEDDGQGIPASFLPHVFDSFRQSDGSESRSHGGLGIGLSISKHLVELHGGSIEAFSEGLGLGARFHVRLPISPLVSASLGVSRVPAAAQPSGRLAVPPGVEGVRVLVVDDDPDARDLVAHFLESCGMQVDMAASAEEALAHLASNTPEVIVSDIGMPEHDGYYLIRSIRTQANEEKSAIPAIALTAFTRNEDRTRALVEGFNRHMPKPVEPSALVQAVAELALRLNRAPDSDSSV